MSDKQAGTEYDPTRRRTIIVRRVVTTVHRVEFTPEYYPGMTLEEAAAYERGRDNESHLEDVFEQISGGYGDPVVTVAVWTNDEPVPQG